MSKLKVKVEGKWVVCEMNNGSIASFSITEKEVQDLLTFITLLKYADAVKPIHHVSLPLGSNHILADYDVDIKMINGVLVMDDDLRHRPTHVYTDYGMPHFNLHPDREHLILYYDRTDYEGDEALCYDAHISLKILTEAFGL